MDLNGIIPPMVTPVANRSGDIDVAELRNLTEHLVNSGVHGVFPCGTTGEFTSLSRNERRTVLNTVADIADSIPVLAGCGGTSISEVGTLIDDASDAGADAAVVVTPYFLPGSQDGLQDFYFQVAESSSLPIILYHIPQRTGQELHPETVQQLATHSSIIGIKDSSGDSRYLYEVLQVTPDSFLVFQGGAINGPTVLSMGANGIVPGEANYLPETLTQFYNSYTSGDCATANSLLREVTELSRPFLNTPLIPTIKFFTNCAGFKVGPPLPPFAELDTSTKKSLQNSYNSIVG